MTLISANILQPFIDIAESIITFFQSNLGFSWGLAIIGLTFTVRLAVLPLSLKGIKSMRRMQLMGPDLKEVQEKYKDDPERKQREMMNLYKEHGVNPLSSCLPFILQIPFFIAIYQLLRGEAFQHDVETSGADKGFLFIKNILEQPHGAELVILIVLFISTTILSFLYTTVTTQTATGWQRYLILILPIAFAPFIIAQPAGLALYWIATNVWSLLQQVIVQRLMPAPPPPTPEEVKAKRPPPPSPKKKKKKRR